jgi:chemotaxis protein MotB
LSNPDIAVLIEGHTDDDAFTASGPIADNWFINEKGDLYCSYFKRTKINKENLTAAGKGEFSISKQCNRWRKSKP